MIWILKYMIVILAILSDAKSSPSEFQENYLEEDKYPPGFLTLGQKYSIAIGSTVILPCKINETEKTGLYVLAWKRDIAVLTAGNVKVTVNPRIRLTVQNVFESNDPNLKSYNLEIRDVRLSDAGDYACQIGTMEPKEIIHHLEVLVPPKINFVAPSTRLDISKGTSVKLECRATGNPAPKIIWSRKNNVMPNGEANITGNILEMMHADRHTVGHYKCTADNRVGQPDFRDFYINVLYAPEIEVERPFVHTGVGFEAQLVCIVHAEPQPHVIWYKDTTQLGTTEQHSQQIRGNRHTLLIRNVTVNDLGNYTCQASNNLGKDRAGLSLSGIPAVCVFDSSTLSNHRNQYNISWLVHSYAPIREYRLFYRKQPKSKLQNHIHLDKMMENNVGQQIYPSHSSFPYEQWENVVIPEVLQDYHLQNQFHLNQHPRHRMSFLIRNLTPASNYEARVQARNDHGWNKLSGVFHFSTRAEDSEIEPAAQPAVSKNAELLNNDVYNYSPQSTQFCHKFIIFLYILSIILSL